jgi:putative transcriptional regulator
MRILTLAVALLLSALPARPQAEPDVAAGCLLVSSRDMRDPNFAQTVILVVSYGDEGAMGIILNRRTKVAASRVFEDWKEAKGHSEPVFLGGPVERMGALALLRSRTNLADARKILGEVHVTSDQGLLGKRLAAGVPPEKFRIYMGYSGWAADQLDSEVDLGAWHVFPANADLVFDPEPETLWDRLIRKTDMRIARL